MLEVRLLGQFDVRRDGTPIVIPSRPAQSLFAFLLLNASVAHRRERLAGLLWPDTTEDNARRNLRHALWLLRKALESKPPRGRAVTYILSDEISIAIDTHAEYRLDASVLECVGEGDASGRDLIAALSLYRGELLPGFYDDWVVGERERLRGIFEQKMARLLERLQTAGRWAEVREWADRWIRLEHTPEAAFRALMLFHYQMGEKSQVAAVYRRCVDALKDLGVEPSEQTRTLFKELMSGVPTPKPESAPPPRTPPTPKPPVQFETRLKKSTTTEPPTGTVTFLFTDIEGSTRGWEKQPDMMKMAIVRHDTLVRDAIEKNRGYVFKTVGDGFCAAFPTALDGLNAAVAAQRSLQAENWGETLIKARMALHTGSVEEREGDYFGRAVNRVARLLSASHGAQILVSLASAELLRDHLSKDASLRDLGEHRLKDLDRPEHIYQLVVPDLPSDFPPPTPRNLPHNLPLQPTSFIGREREMAEVMRLLSMTRLLTLTGDGGVGKTRIALEVGADLLDRFSDGVWLVELASLSDPALVSQTVATALGVGEQTARSLEDALIDNLSHKNLLLILDNCEHMIEACARLASALLSTCAHLKIMATSRQAMNIGGEMVWQVPPLSFQSQQTLEDSTGSEAVRLFVERAQFILPTFRITAANEETVAQICRRLDGLPLAIELAAARVDMLSPEEINKGMDDRFRLLKGGSRAALLRHQTLSACVDWSWNLLSADEQTLFRRLSIFAGTWTLEDAEQICSAEGLVRVQVLDLLASLVRKSLVNVEVREGVSRYRLLETPRLYALERLTDSGEVKRLSAHHRDWYLHLAEAFESEEREKKQTIDWIARLGPELDNLRAALEWSQKEPGGADKGLRLSGALGKFWEKQNALTEGREWLGKFLDLSKNSLDAIARARALYAAGRLAHLQDDHVNAITFFEQCLKIETQDTMLLAQTHLNLGFAFYRRADYKSATKHYDQAIQSGEMIHDPVLVALAQMRLGMIYHELGDLEHAVANHRRSLEAFRMVDHKLYIGTALSNLARIHHQLTDYEQAIEYYTQVIQMYEVLENYYGLCANYLNLSEIYIDRGNYADAYEFLNKCLQLAERLGNNYMKAVAWGDVAICKLNQGEPELALDYALRALELIHKVQAKDQEGVIYRKLGEIRTMLGQREEAQKDFEAARKNLELVNRKSELARLYRSYGKFLMAGASTQTQGIENLERALAMFDALGSAKEVENTRMLLHGAVDKLS